MTRLDRWLTDRGLATSRGRAQALIAAGAVTVDGVVVTRSSTPVAETAAVTVDETDAYVSRAAHKLLGALDDLHLAPAGRALDAGASTGGFTQVLLERGCAEVVAVDVGHDQLADRLRGDPRVVVRERLHVAELTLADVGDQPVDWIVADLSFVSLTKVITPLLAVAAIDATALLLVKPQFEVGRGRLGKNGVVRDPGLHREAVAAVLTAAAALGWADHATVPSRLPGPAGNQEFFVRLSRGPAS